MVNQRKRPVSKLDVLSNRWITLTFLVFGAIKLSDMSGFVDSVVSYNILPEWLARAYAWVLPWVEVVIGILLILFSLA